MSNFCQQGDITKIFIVDTGNTGSTGTDIYVTGGTYFDGTLTLGRNDGITIPITGFSTTAVFTGNTSASCITDLYITNLHGCSPITIWDPIISLSSISATTYYGDGSNLTGIPDNFVTGGTYSNGTLTLNRQNGSLSVVGFLTGTTTDTFVTGFTFSSNTLTITQNQGQTPLTASITTIDLSNIFSAVTFNIGTTGSISASTFYGNGSNLTGIPDNFVTGGTYSNGTLTLNRQNGSVSISGLLSADTYVTGFTFNTGTYDLTIFQNNGITPLTQNLGILAGDITVTGGTYNPNNGVATFYNNAGGSFQVSGFLTGFTDIYLSSGNYNPNTGNLILTRTDNVSITVTGFTDYYVTGGTYSSGTLTLNRQNGTFNISGITDTFVTGFTYSNNNLTINQSQGQTPLTVNISTMTGLTINGDLSTTNLTVTATSNLNGTINSTNLAGTGVRVVQVNSGGTFSASNQIITAYLTSGSTNANILETTNNWDINGVFIGSGITGTYQGQKFYNNNYFFEAVDNDLWIRLIRG